MNPSLQKTLCFPFFIPDTVNRARQYRFDASGKGVNVCRVLTQLGKRCTHLTQLGGPFRSLFLELCAGDGLTVEWTESGSPIRFCYTLLNEADHSVTELVEESEPVKPDAEERLKEAYTRLLPDYETVIISGTKAAGFSEGLVPFMARAAREKGRKLILDIRGKDLVDSLRFCPDLIKPNLFEFAGTFAPDLVCQNGIIDDEARVKSRIRQLCRELYEKYRSRIVLTRGARPVWFSETGDLEEAAFETVTPVNTTGSGDAFTAGLAAALDDGESLAGAVAKGALCGRLNAGCLKVGAIKEG
jgi:1-phosphofructokinase/tagatose 6-phosphate kinase